MHLAKYQDKYLRKDCSKGLHVIIQPWNLLSLLLSLTLQPRGFEILGIFPGMLLRISLQFYLFV